jgi:hypothetical protein
MRASNFLLFVPMILGIGAPSASDARIVEAIINDYTDAQVGSIAFPTLTGSSDAGVLFSYNGFTQSNITSISWTLDANTYSVAALGLNARSGDAVCPDGDISCSYQTLSLSATSVSERSFSCSSFDGQPPVCEGFGLEPMPVSYKVTAIPEPAKWVLGMVGLLGFGSLRWLRPPLSPAPRRAAA